MRLNEMRKIDIFDTTLRDGEQATDGAIYGVKSKLIIAKKLRDLGVDRIEAGFPQSSEGDFEAVRQIAREIDGPWIFGLAGTSTEAVQRAYDAVKDNKKPGIHVFTIMFDQYSVEQAYKTTKDKVIQDLRIAVSHARKLVGDGNQVEFSFQNAVNAPMGWLIEGYNAAIEAGANVINIPDTVGYCEPEEITSIVKNIRTNIPSEATISIHCHQDLGLAVANSLAAVKAGAGIVECTINGIGERAGNASLEEVVMGLITRKDLYKCNVGVEPVLLNELSRLVSYHFEMPVQPNKAIVGSNAFKHKSGIHQDGMVKGGVYEIIDPKSVGWSEESYDLTARSGKKGVRLRLERLGYEIDDQTLYQFMLGYKELADKKRKIDDVDLVVLMDQTTKSGEDRHSLIDISILKEFGSEIYEAKVLLEVDGEKVYSKRKEGNGKVTNLLKSKNNVHVGPIDALYHAIDSVVGNHHNLHLVHYNPINIETGSEATAEVTVILSENPNFDGVVKPNNGTHIGRAYNKDTLRASVEAYLDALNKVERKTEMSNKPH